MVWSWAFAHAFSIQLPWFAPVTLGLGTWCVYVADRLLDGWRQKPQRQLRERHLFYARHRRPFLAALIVAAFPLAYLIFDRVTHRVRTDDVLLGIVGVLYFVLIHSPQKEHASHNVKWMPKEMAVGILFAIATTVPAWSRRPADGCWMLLSIALYAGICSWNCIAIQTWEDNFPRNSLPMETMHRMTRWIGFKLRRFAVILALLAAGLATLAPEPGIRLLLASCSLSALLLLLLSRFSEHIHSRTLRVAADMALLTPLLWMAVVH